MIWIAIAIAVILIIVGFYLYQKGREYGVLNKKKIYSDTEESPGELIYAKTIRLCGKPDYLIKENGMIIPVEIKSGKTPYDGAHMNHQMQLMAYCLLVEEHYGVKPIGGYIKYPEKEFKYAYTPEARQSVINLVNEILEKRSSGEEPRCGHQTHN